jgi:hypothetical protein
METIEMINILLILCLGTLYPYVNGKIAMLEEKIREELKEEIEDVSFEVKETLDAIGKKIQDAGKFDPEDQFQILKLNMFQHFSNFAVDFISKKLGGSMGVHQLEQPPGAPHETESAPAVIIEG